MASFTSSDNNNNNNNTAAPASEESLYEEDNKLSSCAFDEEWEKDGIVDFFRGIVHLPTITAHHSTYAGQPIFIQTPRTKLTLQTEAVGMLPTDTVTTLVAQEDTALPHNEEPGGEAKAETPPAETPPGIEAKAEATSVSGARIIMNITTNMPGKGPIIETHEIA